jgi:hypothetical protein
MRRGYTTPAGQEAQERHDKRQLRNERWRPRQIGGRGMRRGNATTSRTMGTRGDGATRGRGASRWEVAA